MLTAGFDPVSQQVDGAIVGGKKKRSRPSKQARRGRLQIMNAAQSEAPVVASIIYPIQPGQNVPKKKKNKSRMPVMFCRPGVPKIPSDKVDAVSNKNE
jgi:hypothetical protein